MGGRRNRMWLCCCRLALASAWLLAAAPVSAEPVKVRAAPHQGYGRIVFNWPSPVPYTAALDGTRLTVRFGRPIEGDLGPAVRGLRKYLRAGEMAPDGRTAIFTTSGPFEVRAFDLGVAVVVDLVDPVTTARVASEPVPAEARASRPAASAAQPQAPTGPALGVRTGEHEGYSRIVFDWPRRVGYAVDRSGGSAVVTFDRPARPNVGRVQARPPKFLRGIQTAIENGGLKVTLRIPETSRIRHFRSGPKVAIDILAPSPDEPPVAAKPEPPRPQKRAEPEKPAQPAPRIAAKPETPAAPAPAGQQPPPAAATVPETDTPPAELAAKTEPSANAPSATLSGDGVAENRTPESGTPAGPAAPPMPLVPVKPTALTPPAQTASASPTVTPPADAGEGNRLAPTTTAEAADSGPSGPPPAGAVTLRIDWSEPVAAAVFRRADHLWVAFDKPTDVDLAALKSSGGNAIRDVRRMPDENATVLRFDTVAGVNPTLRRDGLAWLLDFQKQPLQPQSPIETNVQPSSPVGARLFLPVPQPGKALSIFDPEVGDTLVVVPVIPLGHGVAERREYPQVNLLPTGQGVVVRPTIDSVRIRPLRQGIELTSTDRLQISQVTPEAAAGSKLASTRPLTRILDFEKWRESDISDFIPQRRELQSAIVNAKGPEKEKARLDLARYYLALGFGAEALGVLDTIADERSGVLNDPKFRALRGSANFLLARIREAEDDWYHESLNNNDEATFWRASMAAMQGDHVRASRVLRRMTGLLRAYPQPLRLPLSLTATEAAVEVGDMQQASHLIDVLTLGRQKPKEDAQIAVVEGSLKKLIGDFEGAIVKWEQAEDSVHRPSRAKAIVAKTELLLELERITGAEAVEEYEKLRFTWRGDDFEFALLRRLGQLYIGEDDYRNGLRTLRQAATHFRGHPEAKAVTQEMTDAFARLYLQGAADVLPPVTAIALYDEFKELTPPGDKGDEMIRKLADRLVAVDLLDRGAGLLDEQIEFRLKGEQKARVGTQLALIRIIAEQPERALVALDASAGNGLPDELTLMRRHLRARALIQLEQTDQSLALLEDDDSMGAERLRAEIHWGRQDWPKAAQSLGRLVRAEGIKAGQEELTEKQAVAVLNLAIAMTLAGNERGVIRTRTDFRAAMDATPYRDAFRLITSPNSGSLSDIRNLAVKVRDAENFQSFIAEYREQLKTKNLSELFAASSPAATG